jgi:hypothetical protein
MGLIRFGAAEIVSRVCWDEEYPEPAVEERAIRPRVMLWRRSIDGLLLEPW